MGDDRWQQWQAQGGEGVVHCAPSLALPLLSRAFAVVSLFVLLCLFFSGN